MMQKTFQGQLNGLCGIPWIYKKSDCWAIFKKAAQVIGINVYDLDMPAKESKKANAEIFRRELLTSRWQRADKPKLGSAIIFYSRNSRAHHIGLAVDNKNMIHSLGDTSCGGRSSCDKIDSLINKGVFHRYEIYNYID